MKQTIACPQCAQKLRVPTTAKELKVTCPKCALTWFWRAEQREDLQTQEPNKLTNIFGKVKDAVTGSGARVNLYGDFKSSLGGQTTIQVSVKIGERPIKTKGVYLELRLAEIIALPITNVLTLRELVNRYNNEIGKILLGPNIEHVEHLIHNQWQLAYDQTLQPHQLYNFEITVQTPDNMPPSCEGKFARFLWQVNAYVDTTLTNPKSGWITLDVRQ